MTTVNNTSGRHNMSQWVKTTDLCFKTDSKSVIFSDASYYVDHWNSNDKVSIDPHLYVRNTTATQSNKNTKNKRRHELFFQAKNGITSIMSKRQ